MDTAKAIRKSNKEKEIRLVRSGNAREAIGRIESDTDLFILTFGQFSLIDALMVILEQTGRADVVLSTWTAAHAHLDRVCNLISQADISSLRMIVDTSFFSRQPKYFKHMIDLFGNDSIRTIRTHAKFMVIKNNKWSIVVRTSMNLNENPRLENIEISTSEKMADFFLEVADDIFKTTKPGSVDYSKISDQIDLSSSDFCEVARIDAGLIDIKELNSVTVTHEVIV
jgi:hypothetical protein